MSKKRVFRILKWFFGILSGLFLLITLVLYIFKDDICQMAISELNKHLKTKVSVSKVDLSFWSTFPNLSVDFNDVFIQDSYPGSGVRDTLLFSERMRFKFDPWEIWQENYTIKSIAIEPGVLMMKVNEAGENNYDIFKPSTDTSDQERVDFHLDEIVFTDFRFRYANEMSGQDHHVLMNNMQLTGNFSERVFSANASSKLRIIESRSQNLRLVSDKLAELHVSVKVNTDSSSVEFPASTIHIEGLPFVFEGRADSTSYAFQLKSKDILIQDAANKLALNETGEIKRFSGSGALLFDLSINGMVEGDQGANIDCAFGINNGSLREPETGITLSKLFVDGKYSNQGGPEKEKLELKEISFQTKGGAFKGALLISQFDKPLYKGFADGLINLAVLQSLVKVPHIERMSGTANLRTDFRVQTTPGDDVRNDYVIEKLEGQVALDNVDVRLENDKRVFSNIRGTGYLRNNELGLDNVSLLIGKSDFRIDGVFKSLSRYLSNTGAIDADVELKSKLIDLSDLGTDSKEDKIQHERAFILPDNVDGKVYLSVNELRYEGHIFRKLEGNMITHKRVIHFPRLAVQSGGADVSGSLTIEERHPEIFQLNTQIVSQNINFAKLFKEWDNFNQNVITSDNISGIAMANMQLEAPFDFRTGIVPNAIKAQIGIKVNNGRLKNVNSFNAITESLRATISAVMLIGKKNINAFENKLLDLKFDELRNTLLIENSLITIPTMSIKSSALDLETSGKHTFDNKIDYRFGFRFRDLKEKELSEFGEIQDDGSGKQVFMRMYGSIDNPKIEWDSETNREKRKEGIEQEKKDVKSILKTEFGLYKKDSTISTYIQEKKQHEILLLDIDPEESIDTLMEFTRPKRDGKLSKYLKDLKKESEAEKKEEFDFEF